MNKVEILIIDDEPQIQKLLKINLESNDYSVKTADNGKSGLLQAANHPPHLILLDIGLPDESGHEILKKLREWYSKPIIILSVQDNETDIVRALDNGATDYLSKPFRSGELLARIRAAIRRSENLVNKETKMVFDELVIDLAKMFVTLNDKVLKLTSTEYNLISLFAKNEGRVLTHKYILKEIWGVGYQTETQYLRVFVGQIRKKIESNPHQPKHIITVNGVGYRFH
ncbi:response regulator [Crocinitomix algicola]|uniref:response regulator n=1 Tax=Crocinitomix algicola TaxID=1740263 RepID=UPI000830E9AE|nr:response regulator transcription factor [Crocinitomix algicola]